MKPEVMKEILLVEDDLTYSRIVKTFLEKNGFSIRTTTKVKDAQQLMTNTKFDLIIADFRLPDGTGMELLQWSKSVSPQTNVILITNYSDIRIAIKAMKLGAFEYIIKPINPDELLATVNESLNKADPKSIDSEVNLKQARPNLPEAPKSKSAYVLGNTLESKKLEKYIQLVAPTDLSILVLGETGTGKELISQRIHQFSKRNKKPFIPIDCGALPKELAGSELFGHVKGAFTGALDNKTGHFERANGGTVLLDEVGNLSYEVQIQLLRAIQERKIRKIGGDKEIEIDIRIIAATNNNLVYEIGKGKFREDLYHRLNEFTLNAIPLRERKSDLEYFALEFLKEGNARLDKNILGFSKEVWAIFFGYDWPGNLREFHNIIKRSVLLTSEGRIETDSLPADLLEDRTPLPNSPEASSTHTPLVNSASTHYKSQWEEQEKNLIQKMLVDTKYNKAKTARILKMDRKTLYSKMDKFGLND